MSLSLCPEADLICNIIGISLGKFESLVHLLEIVLRLLAPFIAENIIRMG